MKMMFKKSFLGTNIALVFGLVSIVAGLSMHGELLLLGAISMLGSVIYRSAKKRRLKLAGSTKLRKVFELLGMATVWAVVLLQNNLLVNFYEHPLANIVAPTWVTLAYILITIQKTQS